MTTPNLRLSPMDMDRLSRLAFNLSHNEKTRRQFAGLVQQVDPGAAKAFGDVFLEQKFDKLVQKLEQDRLAEKMQGAKAARDRQRSDVIQKRGFSDEQVKAVEGIMTHYGLPDWEAAADIYAQRNPQDDPDLKPHDDVPGEATWEFPTVPGKDGKMLSFKDFKNDLNGATRNAAKQVIREITAFKRRQLPGSFHGRAA